MIEFVEVPGGRIAYDVTGTGPLLVLSHGIGVRRQDYRFLAPGTQVFRSLGLWLRYLDLAYPAKPADYADPQAEGDAVVAAMPTGAGTVAMVDAAGHYPHAQSPDEVAEPVIPFLKDHAGA